MCENSLHKLILGFSHEFSQIMGHGEYGKVHIDLVFPFMPKASVMPVEFDLSESSLQALTCSSLRSSSRQRCIYWLRSLSSCRRCTALLKGDLTHLDKKSHHLGEQLVHSILHVLPAIKEERETMESEYFWHITSVLTVLWRKGRNYFRYLQVFWLFSSRSTKLCY